MGIRRTFSHSFKQKAIKMVTEEKRKASEVARELGISQHLLSNWKRKYLEDNADYNPKRIGNEDTALYIKKLEADNRRLKEERDILKKAAIYFAEPTK
jgi:transposase